MQRLLCARCGDSIHPDTAKHNGGLCLPCIRGNQLSIAERTERHRKQREEERARYESPEYKYWVSIVKQVHEQENGYENLPPGDRLYYLLNVLIGEVHNGGFDQYFSNSSGDRYAETLAALTEVGAQAPLKLLLEAKQVLFRECDVPKSQRERFELMATSTPEKPQYEAACLALDLLDKRFYASADVIDQALAEVAERYSLYSRP